MSFKSVNHILCVLQLETKLQEQPFQRLLKCWSEVIGTTRAAHTRPLSIQRNVLWVATSSAAWAQNLTFERQYLLAKLNAVLPNPLVDIRFSTAQWHTAKETSNQKEASVSRQHPSYLEQEVSIRHNIDPTVSDANTIFTDWAATIKTRSHHLPLCPQCQCPTPPGELQRWSVCYLCAAKKFTHQ